MAAPRIRVIEQAASMDRIATLTLNPSIDSASEAEQVFPTHKIRTFGERYDPGGGGINAARVLARLGERVEAIYLAGGITGALLDDLLIENGIDRHRIDIHDHTRMSLTVFERTSGREFRFVPEGPRISETEWRKALTHCAAQQGEWLIASGSLPRGVPENFYAMLARDTVQRGARMVIDTSGPPLAAALDAGGLFLIKPSQSEFEALTGRQFASPAEIGAAAFDIVRAGKAHHVAITLGHEGAVLAHAGGVIHHAGLPVKASSATGAGDSFVAGMVHGFLRGDDAAGAFRWGMAAGTAAVLHPGTGLAHPDDMARMWAALG